MPPASVGPSQEEGRKMETNRETRRKSFMAESEVKKGIDDHGESVKQSNRNSRA